MKKSILFFVVAVLFVAFNASLNAQEAGNQDSKSCINVAAQQACVYRDGEGHPAGFDVHVVVPLLKYVPLGGAASMGYHKGVTHACVGPALTDPTTINHAEVEGCGEYDHNTGDINVYMQVTGQGGPVGGSYRSNPYRVYSTRP